MTDNIKCSFFQTAIMSILLYGCTTWTLTKRMEKRLDSNKTRMLRAILNKSWGKHSTNSSYTATYHPSRKLSELDEADMRDTAKELRTNSKGTYFGGPLYMDEQRRDDQLEPVYNSSVSIQDANLKAYQKLLTIETGGEGGSGRSMLVTQHDDVGI